MDETSLHLLTDLHINNHRQGPGSDAAFMQALQLSGIDTKAPLAIADIGCGTGSATIPLLTHTNATVTAVDFLPAFLEKLVENARKAGVADRVHTLEADMANLPFAEAQFDVLWSEGAIYNVGFAEGIRDWHSFLKPHGILAVSEITWLKDDLPEPVRIHWEQEYPEIATAKEKVTQLQQHGYTLIDYFVLPPDCWLENYYHPLTASFPTFLDTHDNSQGAQDIVTAELKEITLYEQYQACYSYGFYIAQKN